MKGIWKTFRKAFVLFLSFALVVSMLPATTISIEAADNTTTHTYNKVSDGDTAMTWRNFFPDDSTENAGAIWTDKSVFENKMTLYKEDGTLGQEFTATDNNMLVGLSAMGSTLAVTGETSIPTDTMFVLDLSVSMSGQNLTDLVNATNESINKLLESNDNNRIGVVLYGGVEQANGSLPNDTIITILPLSRYMTTDSQNRFLNYSNRTVSLNRSVEYDNDPDNDDEGKPTYQSMEANSATYIQQGIYLAEQEFTDETNITTINDPNVGKIKRVPVMVLMSDGAPSMGSTNFQNPTAVNNKGYNIGSGGGTNARISFATQLTAANAKYNISEKYDTTCFFYTLGLGVDNDNNAVSVLNPSQSSGTINGYWTRYNNAANGALVSITNDVEVVKRTLPAGDVLSQNYVNQYYSASSGENGLLNAFDQIIEQIEKETATYPTLVKESEHVSGYVSFVDSIGEYMEVKKMHGIMMHGQFFSGAEFARSFVNTGGSLGTTTNPTERGDEFIRSVRSRLELDLESARNLVTMAYNSGQLAYDTKNTPDDYSDDTYSNYIGWYTNDNNDYLGFWHDGNNGKPATTTPDGATHVVKSYLYLGELNESHGVKSSDMMYVTVRIKERIAADDIDEENGIINELKGQQTIAFGIPASMLPLVNYTVKLDEDGTTIESIDQSGARAPIRLVYEVGLYDEINAYNVRETVHDIYWMKNKTSDGIVKFYTNKWSKILKDDPNTVSSEDILSNTYAYYEPDIRNKQYYFTENTYIYSDTLGTLYDGSKPTTSTTNTYRKFDYYIKTGTNSYSVASKYYPISSVTYHESEEHVDKDETGWYIKEGTPRHAPADLGISGNYNDNHNTNTNEFSSLPFAQRRTDPNVLFIGEVLGNNGVVSFAAETGIKLSKTINGTITESENGFKFTIQKESDDTPLEETVTALLTNADGSESTINVTFDATGKAEVTLKDGQSMYIGGLTPEKKYTITEEIKDTYKVEKIVVNGTIVISDGHSVTIEANDMQTVDYTNTERLTGTITIGKLVEHELVSAADIAAINAKEFTFNGTIKIGDVPIKAGNYKANKQGETNTINIAVNEQGEFTVVLKHNDTIQILGLPEGATVEITETDPGTGFTRHYWKDGVELGGNVTSSSAIVDAVNNHDLTVKNIYTPLQVSPVNVDVHGTKFIRLYADQTWESGASYSFSFQIQKLNNGNWIDVGNPVSTTIDKAAETGAVDVDKKTFDFDSGELESALANEEFTTAGTYSYRVVETITGAFPENSTVSVKDIINDTRLHPFDIIVGDNDLDGQLEITSVTTARTDTTSVTTPETNSWLVTTDFENTYNKYGTNVVVEFDKDVINSSNSTLATLSRFQFVLVPDENNPIGFKDTITSPITSSSGLTRLSLDFDAVGTYNYTLKEVIPTGATNNQLGAWIYDNSEINITINVNNVNGVLEASIVEESDKVSVSGNTITATFENTYNPTEAVVNVNFVKKILEGREGKAGEFEFSITPRYGAPAPTSATAENSEFTTSDNGAYAGKQVANVNFGTITFDKVGTYYYEVKETKGNLGGITYDPTTHIVTVTVTDNGGRLNASVSVPTSSTNDVVFTNVYKAEATDVVVINGDKDLTGKDLEANAFIFDLKDNNGNVIDYINNNADGTFKFELPAYTTTGIYEYTINERRPGGEGTTPVAGITYDSTIYDVTVTVTDPGTGKLEAEVVVANTTNNLVKFNNTYQATPATIALNITKLLNSLETFVPSLTENKFEFELYKTDGDYDTTGHDVLEKVGNDVNGRVSFEAFDGDGDHDYSFSTVGSYYFVIKEVLPATAVNGVKDGIIYDDEIRVEIEVTDNTIGQLEAYAKFENGNGLHISTAEFVNTYDVPNDATTQLQIQGTKMLSGRDLVDGEFTFELTDASGAEVNGEEKLTATNQNGKFEFEALTFTGAQIGETFTYIVKESKGGTTDKGVTYTGKEYTITVEVQDDGKGGVQTEVDVLNTTNWITQVISGLFGDETFVFENTYGIANSTSATIEGKKDLDGRPLKENEFEFKLVDAEGNKVNDKEKLTAKNKADGTFSFEIVYPNDILGDEKEKTFTYRITEVNNSLGGVVYDTSTQEVQVKVTDNLEGELVTQVIYPTNEEVVEFENTYAIKEAATVTIDGLKELTGKDLENEEFSFEIYEGDSTTPRDIVKNDANGKFEFEITYPVDTLINNKTKEFVYTIKEVIPTEAVNGVLDGMKYDTKEVEVTVEVSDDLKGNLVTKVTKPDGGVVFRNEYNGSTENDGGYSAEVELKKTVKNSTHGLDGGEFTFELYQHKSDGTKVKIDSATNDNKGKIEFSALHYRTTKNATGTGTVISEAIDAGYVIDKKEVDGNTVYTFKYHVHESEEDMVPGVTITDKFYDFTVEVTDLGNGVLIAKTDYAAATGNPEATYMEFVNTYAAESVEIDIKGSKNLFAKDELSAPDITNKFTFTLEAITEGAPLPEVTTTTNATIAGNIDFGNIKFELSDLDGQKSKEFVYKVVESGFVEGVTNDTDKIFSIIVTDDGEGKLIAQRVPGDRELFEFVNTYDVRDLDSSITDTFQIEINKELRGRDQKAGEFKFELYEGDTVVAIGTNDKDGKVIFSSITYTTPGYHVYTVKEVDTKVKDVTYDTKTYKVHTSITDNGNGTMKATHVVENSNDNTITFKNTYSKPVVDTGDYTNVGLWTSLLMLTSGLMAILFIKRRKEEDA